MFKRRATEAERIDTGDYTPEEYDRFLHEIRVINRRLGDRRALTRSLLAEIAALDLAEFSVLDVGAGSGELLSAIADFASRSTRRAYLVGLDMNERSVVEMGASCQAVRGDAFHLPFDNGAFDFAISSLFFHHLNDDQIPIVLKEMVRVARRAVFVIDLHRHPAAYYLYKLFCFGFRISPLVREDGSLSVLKGFKPEELLAFARQDAAEVTRTAPFRIVMRCSGIGDLGFDEHLQKSK